MVRRSRGQRFASVLLLVVVTASWRCRSRSGWYSTRATSDFPYSPLTAAIVPIVLVAVILPASGGDRRAERIAERRRCVLALAVYIAFNESFVNWQSLWLCALILALGAILLRSRAGPRKADDQQGRRQARTEPTL